jgi:ribose/xylose/arabinose/galactoside ABC-type transport system permease subunit
MMAAVAENRQAYEAFIGIIAAIVGLGLMPSTLALLFCIAGLGWDVAQPPIGIKATPQSLFGAVGAWFIFPVLVVWALFVVAAALLWLFHRRMTAKDPVLRSG